LALPKSFRDDENVLTLSIHCKNNFPLRKQTSCIDIELDSGTEDAVYLAQLAEVLPQIQSFHPDIIFGSRRPG